VTEFWNGGPSSRLDLDTGQVVVTSPCSWAEPGRRLRVIASAQTFGLSFEDWRKRLPKAGNRALLPEDEIERAIETGLIHPSLAAEPREPEAA
jgi:hypothetical protein